MKSRYKVNAPEWNICAGSTRRGYLSAHPYFQFLGVIRRQSDKDNHADVGTAHINASLFSQKLTSDASTMRLTP